MIEFFISAVSFIFGLLANFILARAQMPNFSDLAEAEKTIKESDLAKANADALQKRQHDLTRENSNLEHRATSLKKEVRDAELRLEEITELAEKADLRIKAGEAAQAAMRIAAGWSTR